MKNNIYLSLLCITLLSCTGEQVTQTNELTVKTDAEPAKLRGTVAVKENDELMPDAGAVVYAVSTTRKDDSLKVGEMFNHVYYQASVDMNGSYEFPSLPADKYMVVFASKNALNYHPEAADYRERFGPVLEPYINTMAINETPSSEMKDLVLDVFFKNRHTYVSNNIVLGEGEDKILNREFIVYR